MRERNIEVVRSWIEEAWSKGDLSVADDLLTSGFVLHDPVAAREVVGRDAERELIAGLRRSIPDLTFTIDDVVAEGDDVTIRWTAEGTHGGELAGNREHRATARHPRRGHVPTGGRPDRRVLDVLGPARHGPHDQRLTVGAARAIDSIRGPVTAEQAPTASTSMRKPSCPYGEAITCSGDAERRRRPAAAAPAGRAGRCRRRRPASAPVTRASAASTPPRPRPTSWEFIASVSTT